MKKYLLITLIIAFAFPGCKKSSTTPFEAIQVNLVIPNLTTYTLQIKNANNSVSIYNAMTNAIFTINAHHGDQIPIVYQFDTQNSTTGQGTISFSYNGSTLLTINGGSGTQTLIVP